MRISPCSNRYLAASPLTHVHVFPYSDRPGTDAAALPGKVHGSIVRERAAIVRDIGRDLTGGSIANRMARSVLALTIEDGSLVVTDNYLKVRIPEGLPRNEWVKVQISSVGEALAGILVASNH